MKSKNVVLGAVLATLVVSGSVWAASNRPLPVIEAQAAAASSSVSQTIIDNIDHYDSSGAQATYHAKINDPNIPWSEKCQLAIRHGRLSLLSTDIGGTLGGTVENGRSFLRVRLLCPEPVAVFDIPADFVVHAAPHPEEVQPMSFETQMHSIKGEATNVGPFAYISLVGGNANGFESPGRTSLIRVENGYAVDSTFNIGYHIEWVGSPDGPLAGAKGSTDSSILMKAIGPNGK